jgi:predicted nuclease with RNAse H fold
MTVAVTRWLGVDVGGPGKGFDVALIDERRLLRLERRQSCDDVVAIVQAERPAVVAIDSPRTCAPAGDTTRDCERALNHAVCGIRWTPDETHVRANPYYRWIVEGLTLYAALDGSTTIEVFPTASWTRWIGPRAGSRAAWTSAGMKALGLTGLPARTNQDQRDAIAAALTARQHSERATESFGEIVVPVARAAPRGRRAPGRSRADDPV